MNNIFGLVYSNPVYILILLTIFIGLFLSLIILSEFLFLEPFLVFHVYPETELSFSLVVLLSILSAIAISMNVYRVRLIKNTNKIGSSIIGTIIGASAGACSCGPLAFTIITTFGTAGSVASSFVTVYEIQKRLISILILGTSKSLSRECKLNL